MRQRKYILLQVSVLIHQELKDNRVILLPTIFYKAMYTIDFNMQSYFLQK